MGLGATVGLLGLGTLGLFVLTFVFLGQRQTAQKELADLKATASAVVSDGERNTDALQIVLRDAKAANKTVAGYFQDQTNILSQKITGASGKSLKDLGALIDTSLADSGQSNLLGLLDDRRAKPGAPQKSAADADAARTYFKL